MLRPAALLVVLLALVPSAAAEGFALPEGRTVEAALDPATAVFRAPIDVKESGALYAKLLDTPTNSAFANGSWLVTLALERADGSRVELGDRSNDRPTDLVPVTAGERVVLVADVRAPDDAQAGNRAIVAIAMRAEGAAASGSGATIDEARAISLILSSVPATAGPGPGAEDPGPGVTTTPTLLPTPSPTPSLQSNPPIALANQWLVVMVALLGLVAGLLLVAIVLLAMLVRDGRAARKERTVPIVVPVVSAETPAAPEKKVER